MLKSVILEHEEPLWDSACKKSRENHRRTFLGGRMLELSWAMMRTRSFGSGARSAARSSLWICPAISFGDGRPQSPLV